MNPSKDVLDNGAIAIHKGKIVAIDNTDSILSSFYSENIFNFEKKMIIPGFINTHTYTNELFTWLCR